MRRKRKQEKPDHHSVNIGVVGGVHLTDLWRKSVAALAHGASSFSQWGAFGKPGTLHPASASLRESQTKGFGISSGDLGGLFPG